MERPLRLNIVDEDEASWRILSEADLERLGTVRGDQKPIPLTKRMTMRHHALARYLALGMPDFEAAALTGYKPATISVLKTDPAFHELMDFYRKKSEAELTEVSLDLHKRMFGMSVDAADELHRRVEEEPETFSHGQLLDVMKVTADRTGHGPSQSTNITVSVSMSDRLRHARERVNEDRLMRDITPEPGDER